MGPLSRRRGWGGRAADRRGGMAGPLSLDRMHFRPVFNLGGQMPEWIATQCNGYKYFSGIAERI